MKTPLPSAGPEHWRPCFDKSHWWVSEQKGCGQLAISSGPGEGGWTYVYDETSHKLIGAHIFSDVGFGACNLSSYGAGVPATCTEGTTCSLCDAPETECAPACSIEALERASGPLTPFDDDVKVRDYGDDPPDVGPQLASGCGRIRVLESGTETDFDAASHQPVSFSESSQAGRCKGQWGEVRGACADETLCSLVQGNRDACQTR